MQTKRHAPRSLAWALVSACTLVSLPVGAGDIYRSIGTAPDYTTGSVTATAGDATVTGTGTAWRSANRGRGDRITINGIDYVVAQVSSDASLVLTTPASTTYSGSSYTIARQFTTLTSWEDCVDGPGGTPCPYFPVASNDLVADDRNEIGIAYKDTRFTENLDIQGASTDADHYITLTVDPGNRHSGIAGTGVILDPAASGPDLHAIAVEVDHTRIEWLEITGWAGNSSEGVRIGADNTVMEYLIIHGGPETTHDQNDGFYVGPDTDLTGTIRNTIVYNVPRAGILLQNFQGSATLDFDVENVSVYNCGTVGADFQRGGLAMREEGNTTILNATNVISVGNTNNDFTVVGAGSASWGASDHNVSSDTSAPPSANRWPSTPAAGEFVSIVGGSEDLHLRSTAVALDKGTALSVARDIDFEGRPKGGAWDIGADEAVASFICPTERAAWFDAAWGYRKAILLNSTLVAGPLRNFPVLVQLDDDADVAANARADFNDIVFAAADGVTKLAHEIEGYDSGQGDLTAWVNVPYLSNGSDTVIYLYYGNAGAGSQQDVPNVWDSGHRGVWHLKEDPVDPAPQFLDSTANPNDGTASALAAGNQVPGPIDGSLVFDDSNERHVNVPDDPSLRIPIDITASAWVRTSDTDADVGVIVNKWGPVGTRNYWLGKNNASDLTFFVNDTETVIASLGLITDGSWHHVVGVADSTAGLLRIYTDGEQRNTAPYSGTTQTGANALHIGNSSDVITFQEWSGGIDEVRVSATTRSAEWIQTEYNNQLDPIADPIGFCLVCAATTEVTLESFQASGFDGEIRLEWRTASELDNLGFHLYRATSEAGPYERITEQVIPGLMSSAVGAGYSYRDMSVINGTSYFYELEDIEASGKTARHGPVSATPQRGVKPDSAESHTAEQEEEEETTNARITYGEPAENRLDVVRRSANSVILRVETSGFHAVPLDDGTVRISIPGLDEVVGEGSLPVKRSWLDAVPGLDVKLVSVEASHVEAIDGLVPAGLAVDELVASGNGTVRRRRRRLQRVFSGRGLDPEEPASIVSVGFQGDAKKALVELAPLRWDAASGRLLLAKELEVRVAFRGRDLSEGWSGRRSRGGRSVLARLVTNERGLYAARFEDVVGRGRALPARSLRLSRQGEVVAYRVEPNPKRFGSGSTLYFLGEGDSVNPYGSEAVYELEIGEGQAMAVTSSPPAGEPTPFYWKELMREENRFYQPGLVQASEVWLWDLVMARETKSYPFALRGLAPVGERSHMTIWLQGTSDESAPMDHHIRAYVNGSFVGESSWDGKQAALLEAELLPHVLSSGDNVLELENAGDTGSDYSMVMLDRFSVRYPSPLTFESSMEGLWSVSGTAEVPESYVLDVTSRAPRWLGKTSRFRADAGHRYVAVSEDAVLRPIVERPRATGLRSKRNRADYVVIGNREFLRAAEPLLVHRRSQGLRIAGVPTEELFSEFGFGETNPQAIQDFVAYAYHEWRAPSPRYVLLLGDATFDFKDYLQTGVVNHVPSRIVKTTYLWTASDPSYAAVNGDDILPDLAIGRLPASDADELRVMVDKILAYETGGVGLDAPVVLVADNADGAGHFEADADELATSVLAERNPRRIYLSQLGTTAARDEILGAFDGGASLVSYIGHGAIHLWADENVFNTGNVSSLTPQSQQPLLLTMNCLNGYFHFPYFDSLAEALVKADGKGAIAALSPSGLSLNAPANRYHEALLREIFSSRHERLGDAVLSAQESYAATGAFPELLSIYHLFGDPALRIRQSAGE